MIKATWRSLCDALGPRRRKDEVGQPVTTTTIVNPDTGEEYRCATWIAALIAEALDARAARSAAIDAAGLPPEDDDGDESEDAGEDFVELEHPTREGVSASVPRWAALLVQQHQASQIDPIADSYARHMTRGTR